MCKFHDVELFQCGMELLRWIESRPGLCENFPALRDDLIGSPRRCWIGPCMPGLGLCAAVVGLGRCRRERLAQETRAVD